MKEQTEILVSVILPVYNGEEFLKQAIESVLNQTFTNFEFIIINDGSTDRSKEIILSFNDSRIKYVENEENLRLIRTLNKGISLASGIFIARMDADDICTPDRFEKQVKYMQNHPKAVMCGSWAKIIDLNEQVTGRIKRIDSNHLIRVNMLFTTPFVHPSVLIRTTALNKIKYNPDALHCEDLELWTRLAEDKDVEFANLPYFLLQYRWHTTNISVQHSNFQQEHTEKLLLPNIEALVGKMTPNDIKAHFLSFRTLSKKTPKADILACKNHFLRLSSSNREKNMYSQVDLDALLFSRWIILSLKTRSIYQIPFIKLHWWNLSVLYKTCRLLIYK